MADITLETDDVGIWLVENGSQGTVQLGHVSWYEVTKRIEQQMSKERFLVALAAVDAEDDLI